MKNKKFIENSLYIVGIIGSLFGWYCFFSDIKFLCIVSFGVFLYQLIKNNTQLGKLSFFFAISIMAVIMLIETYLNKKQINEDFLIYGGWKTIGIIEKKTNYRGDNWRLDFHYISRTNIEVKKIDHCPNKEIYNMLNINDTILIVHSNKDVSDCKISKYFPTHEEILKYKKGVPYEPKKTDASQ